MSCRIYSIAFYQHQISLEFKLFLKNDDCKNYTHEIVFGAI